MPAKIPTLLGLVLLGLFVGGFIMVFERVTRNPSLASLTIEPKNVEITNISDSGFTFSWTTDAPSSGALSITRAAKSQVVYDERDQSLQASYSKKLGLYTSHNVSFRSAQPETLYTVKILSNGKTFLSGSVPYQVTTGPTLTGPTTGLEPAYGTVVSASGEPASGALVYISVEGSQSLSTFVSSSGSWLIPLNAIRRSDVSLYLPVSERMTESITVRLGTQESAATTDTLNDSPVPEMQLGKSYDFRRQQASRTTLAESQGNVLGQTTPFVPNQNKVTFTSPADGSVLISTRPLIEGTGIPGGRVSIIVGITNPIGGSTTIGTDGLWRYTPTKALIPGKQSVTITTSDANGNPIALTHTFEILKSGTQVLGVATQSATLTPTITATPTSTLSGAPIPETGNILPIFIFLVIGLGLMASGAVVFIK